MPLRSRVAGLKLLETTVVPLQFPRIEHQPLPLLPSLLELVFKPLTPHSRRTRLC